MKGIILAAGEGKRLRPLTENLPKSMINFCGMTLLERQIGIMKRCNINDIIVITGYMAEKINIPGINYIQNKNFEKTNMVETLFCAEKELVGDVIISYADIIYEQNVLDKLIKSKEKISIVIDNQWERYWKMRFDEPLKDAESLKINEYGDISEIGQKADSVTEIQGQYIGLIKFNSLGVKVLKDFYKKCKDEAKNGKNILNSKIPFERSYMTDLLQGLILSGNKLKPITIEKGWLEFDSINDYELYQDMYKEKNLNELIDLEK